MATTMKDTEAWSKWSLDINLQHNGALYDLAEEYHQRTEQYDRIICTGPIRYGGIVPETGEQRNLINKHALFVMREIVSRAESIGFSPSEMRGIINQVGREYRYKE